MDARRMYKKRTHRQYVLGLAAAVTLALHPQAGRAEELLWPGRGLFPAYPQVASERGVHAYAFGDAVFDSNLFRLSDEVDPIPVADDSDENGSKKSDRYVRAGAGVRADVDWSRQQLHFDVNASHYSFDRYSLLDEWLYGGDLSWRWQASDRFKGSIGYARSKVYPDFAELQFASQDLVTRQAAHFGLDMRVLSRVELRTLVQRSSFDHDDPERRVLDNTVTAGTAGLFYVSPLNMATGVQYKVSDGDYPNRQAVGDLLVDNQYRETETSLVIAKPFETSLGLDLRVGYTEREHEEVPQRDFSGATGRMQLRYSPTAKTSIYLIAYRELQAVEDLDASYADARGGSIGPAWAPTSTILLQLAYVYEDRVLAGDPGFVITDTPPREDETRTGRVSLGYEPNDNFKVSLSYERGTRTSNVLTADYDYNLAMLRAVLTL
jgi:exopolysaccharide biosynthesis operon protein EpsL